MMMLMRRRRMMPDVNPNFVWTDEDKAALEFRMERFHGGDVEKIADAVAAGMAMDTTDYAIMWRLVKCCDSIRDFGLVPGFLIENVTDFTKLP